MDVTNEYVIRTCLDHCNTVDISTNVDISPDKNVINLVIPDHDVCEEQELADDYSTMTERYNLEDDGSQEMFHCIDVETGATSYCIGVENGATLQLIDVKTGIASQSSEFRTGAALDSNGVEIYSTPHSIDPHSIDIGIGSAPHIINFEIGAAPHDIDIEIGAAPPNTDVDETGFANISEPNNVDSDGATLRKVGTSLHRADYETMEAMRHDIFAGSSLHDISGETAGSSTGAAVASDELVLNPNALMKVEKGEDFLSVDIIIKMIENRGYQNDEELAELSNLLENLLSNDLSDAAVREQFHRLSASSGIEISPCEICYDGISYRRLDCCNLSICDDCLKQYVRAQVLQGIVRIGCPGDRCKESFSFEEIRRLLDPDVKIKYDQFLVDANREPHRKTCPRCSDITTVELELLSDKMVKKTGLNLQCNTCHLNWCFICHAPWHQGLTCKQFRAGDKLLKNWTKAFQNGQVNAQKCPRCKVYIQRNEGCSHMTCSQCSAEFCYVCGLRMHEWVVNGVTLEAHNKKFSIFGCPQILLPNCPVGRGLIRGSIFGSKVLVVPIISIVVLACLIGLLPLILLGAVVFGIYKIVKVLRK